MRCQPMAWALSMLLLFTAVCAAQSQMPPPGFPPGRIHSAPDAGDGDETQQRIARDAAKKANLDRQATLKADSDKLFKLAEELKDSVDKSNENILSLEVLKKAEEIEKLAHSVKEKMRGAN